MAFEGVALRTGAKVAGGQALRTAGAVVGIGGGPVGMAVGGSLFALSFLPLLLSALGGEDKEDAQSRPVRGRALREALATDDASQQQLDLSSLLQQTSGLRSAAFSGSNTTRAQDVRVQELMSRRSADIEEIRSQAIPAPFSGSQLLSAVDAALEGKL